MSDETQTRLRADFNGLFGEFLCLSHRETCVGVDGADVIVSEGMMVTAFDDDVDDDGNPDDLIATGRVERPPNWLQCNGSRWALRIDSKGVRHESDVRGEAQKPK
jgi:hypothetical protein